MPTTDSTTATKPVSLVLQDPHNSDLTVTFTFRSGLPAVFFGELNGLFATNEVPTADTIDRACAIIATYTDGHVHSSNGVDPAPTELSVSGFRKELNDLAMLGYVTRDFALDEMHLRPPVLIYLQNLNGDGDYVTYRVCGGVPNHVLAYFRRQLPLGCRVSDTNVKELVDALAANGCTGVELVWARASIGRVTLTFPEFSGALKTLANMGYDFMPLERDNTRRFR